MSLLEVEGLVKRYPVRQGFLGRAREWFTAVDDVGFTAERGETLALVGESGAGKSTTGRLILRLVEPDAGTVRFDGVDVRALDQPALRTLRRRMQMIFQDPYSSLDPHLPVGESVAEPLHVHFGMSRGERLRRTAELLDVVGISHDVLERYPAELSGGQLQRAAIARALTMKPDLIVADEPVAALDVSVRAQVLNLMLDLQRELGLTYLFITHDLSLVEVIADRAIVMSGGRIVEQGRVEEIFENPREDYTRELLAAIPRPIPMSLRGPAPQPPAVPADVPEQPLARVEAGKD
ncbi:ATP-binding cassette domain-containing protein [Pseudonocardia lacus]|uniref:ATP-binding cassette domain-containing protein n=1 Tax=Pseudonocardia lacus TaxID=2835865 RepID=UPI001BDBE610|nr:ATP-binding cassette domain-containing protein [Pseudonocardia lacus]